MESDDESQPDPGEPVANPDEVRAALRDLSVPHHQRLMKAANLLMRFHPVLADDYEAGDLLQMAAEAALRGTRKWPRSRVDFVKFLAETMRSIASNESRKLKQGMHAHLAPKGQGDSAEPEARKADPVESVVSEAPGPEEALVEKQDEAERVTKLTLLRVQLADDKEIAEIFELQLKGLSKREIRDRLGMDSRRFWSADRRLTRRIEQIIGRFHDHDF
jgi:hypothetical protein